MRDALRQRVTMAEGSAGDKQKFLARIRQGNLTRAENRFSHFCVYFAAYDPVKKRVFIGHHKKSDLWLFNGGHIEPDELPEDAIVREANEEWGLSIAKNTLPPIALITLTVIEHPEKQICRKHYDLWYFLPYDASAFHPDGHALGNEFFICGWKSYDEAERLLTSLPTKDALHYLKNNR